MGTIILDPWVNLGPFTQEPVWYEENPSLMVNDKVVMDQARWWKQAEKLLEASNRETNRRLATGIPRLN